MRIRAASAIFAAAIGFAAGAASLHAFEHEARAEGWMQQASTVYVPPEGLAFRNSDGRVVARLAYDARGGYFEVYDGREHPAAALPSDAIGAFRRGAPRSSPAPLPAGDVDLGY